MLNNVQELLSDFHQVARISKIDLNEMELKHEVLNPLHKPCRLPSRMQAVYVFSLIVDNSIVLKVGKVGPNSNARFCSQHYAPGRAQSSVANSILQKKETWPKLNIKEVDENHIEMWIRENTDRDHFFIPANKGKFLLSLLEAFLQCRLKPLFEG